MSNYSYVYPTRDVSHHEVDQMLRAFVLTKWGDRLEVEYRGFLGRSQTHWWLVFVPGTNDTEIFGEAATGEEIGFTVELEGQRNIGFRGTAFDQWCTFAQKFVYHSFASAFGVTIHHDALGYSEDEEANVEPNVLPYTISYRRYLSEYMLPVREPDNLKPVRERYLKHAPEQIRDL
jgi:hypothetical protein